MKMSKLLLLLLFVGTPNLILTVVPGVPIHIFVYVQMFFSIVYMIYNWGKFAKKCMFPTILISSLVIYTVFQVMYINESGRAGLGSYTLFPLMIFFIVYVNYIRLDSKKGTKYKIFVQNIVLFFYLLDCIIAITERVLRYNFIQMESIFENDNIYFELLTFRSAGILGQQLQDSLFVATVMLFLLISNIRYKYVLWLIGFIAILCFNSRFATVISVCYFFLHILINKNISYKKKILIVISTIPVAMVFYNVMASGVLGGRFLDRGFDSSDYSIDTRFAIFNLFVRLNLSDFIIGISQNAINRLLFINNIRIAENCWIVMILKYGLCYTIPYLILLFYSIFNKHFNNWRISYTLFFTSGFFIIASSNNSLVVSQVPLAVFLLCIFSFNNLKNVYDT